MAGKGPVVPPLPPKTKITCRRGHTSRTRLPAGSQIPCGVCGSEGHPDVTITVPAPLPSIRPEVTPYPRGVDIVRRRRADRERWHCAGCLGSVTTPAPGEPPLGWVTASVGVPTRDQRAAELELLIRVCSVECLAKSLPAMKDRLDGKLWARPEPGPGKNGLAAVMREMPRRR